MRVDFLGDVFLDRVCKVDLPMDRFIFNFEHVASSSDDIAHNKVILSSDGLFIKETFSHNPIAVSLANNHTLDYGSEALKETIKLLESEDISYFGAGDTDSCLNNPYLLHLGEKKIAILGYVCPSTHPAVSDDIAIAQLHLDSVIQDIRAIRDSVDFVVLQFHWGDEEISFPKYSDVQIAHSCIDAGADLIVGHHAHIVQSHEIYRDKHIYYGIGNFIFPDINMGSMHDGTKFTKRFVKKQRRSNRESMVVTLTSDLEVGHYTVKFQDGVVKKRDFVIPKWIPTSDQSYKKRVLRQRKINMIRRFVENPRVPNMTHVKRLLGVKA